MITECTEISERSGMTMKETLTSVNSFRVSNLPWKAGNTKDILGSASMSARTTLSPQRSPMIRIDTVECDEYADRLLSQLEHLEHRDFDDTGVLPDIPHSLASTLDRATDVSLNPTDMPELPAEHPAAPGRLQDPEQDPAEKDRPTEDPADPQEFTILRKARKFSWNQPGTPTAKEVLASSTPNSRNTTEEFEGDEHLKASDLSPVPPSSSTTGKNLSVVITVHNEDSANGKTQDNVMDSEKISTEQQSGSIP